MFSPVRQRLVRTHPVTGRKSLYLASHAGTIVGWPVPEARALLRDLTEHATQPQFVYVHRWRQYDLVMWDNRQTMHRVRRFDESAGARHAPHHRRRRRADRRAGRGGVRVEALNARNCPVSCRDGSSPLPHCGRGSPRASRRAGEGAPSPGTWRSQPVRGGEPPSGDGRCQPRHDHALDHARQHHAGPRQHDPQRRPAAYPGQPVGLAGPDRLGADLVHRLRRDHDAADRLARRPVRHQTHLPRLGDRLSRSPRRCAASPTSLDQLVVFRALQGIAGAGLIPLSQATLLRINPPERHGTRWRYSASARSSGRSWGRCSAAG